MKGLKKTKVTATLTPWTHGRLTYTSGYGAGIASPGWYAHLWRMSGKQSSSRQTVIGWMTKVAHLLREKDLDASSASVIESVRLEPTASGTRITYRQGLSGRPGFGWAMKLVWSRGGRSVQPALDNLRRLIENKEK